MNMFSFGTVMCLLRVGCRSNLIILLLGGQEYIKIEMPEFIEMPHAQQQQHQQFSHRKQDPQQDQQHSDQQVEDEHHLVDDDGNQEDDQHQQHSSYELDEADSDLEMLYQPNESGTEIGSAYLFTRYSRLF